jgi:hypothetical protein
VRLLDQVAQSTRPFLVRQDNGDVWRLSGASDFALQVTRCPLRYVLSDELVRVCVELAYSEGDDLSGCLDLLHLPAELVWIEWNAAVQCEQVARVVPESVIAGDAGLQRHGALIFAQPSGRVGTVRTFWTTRADPGEPLLAAVETLLDLDRAIKTAAPPESLFDGELISVRDPCNSQVDRLFHHAGFRLDPDWQRYYSSVACTSAIRAQIIRLSLATVAFDVPVLLALFLLMALRAGLRQVPVHTSRLNAKRVRLGKLPLLEHVEVSSPVFAVASPLPCEQPTAVRGAPRLHHVRGHIVRRRDAVFWRRPHWRGHLRLGCVRSRTVKLRLTQPRSDLAL